MIRLRELAIRILLGGTKVPPPPQSIHKGAREDQVEAIRRIQAENQNLLDQIGLRAEVEGIRERLRGRK